jgi:hypothetical protein
MLAICKLCMERKPLVSSHLIPGAVYDLCSNDRGEHIFINSKVAMYSSREVQDYLLCYECDNSLNKNGETWMLPKLAKTDGTFPLLDIVEKVPANAVLADGAAAYIATENPGLSLAAIVHFALGIFWKASIHSWKEKKTEPMIDLGLYGSRIAQFLKGKANFPEHMALLMSLARRDKANVNGGSQPARGRCKTAHNYSFCVPGVQFSLYVGKQISNEAKALCIQSSALHPILVDDISGHLLKILSRMGKTAHISKRLLACPRSN